MRAVCCAVAACAAVVSLAHADMVAQWNFNDTTPGATAGVTTPNVGWGAVAGFGGISTAVNVPGAGSSDPLRGLAGNFAYTTSSYASQGGGSGARGVRFDATCAGWRPLSVTFDQRNSGSASRYWRLEYTVDALAWTTGGLANDGIYAVTSTTFANGIGFDLSGIAAAVDNPYFAMRIVAIFAPGTGSYAATQDGSNYATSGTVRWDMFTLHGEAVPGPGALALMVLGIAVARRRRA